MRGNILLLLSSKDIDGNSTLTLEPDEQALISFSCAFLIIVSIAAIVGNLLVFVIFATDRKLRSVKANWFVISLATADLKMGAIAVPVTVSLYIDMSNFVKKLESSSCAFSFLFPNVCIIASLWSLFAVTLDRFVAIKWPLHYQRKITRRRSIAAIIIIWVIAYLAGFMPMYATPYLRSVDETDSLVISLCGDTVMFTHEYFLVMSLVFILPPVAGIITFYMIISRIAGHHLRLIAQFDKREHKEKERKSSVDRRSSKAESDEQRKGRVKKLSKLLDSYHEKEDDDSILSPDPINDIELDVFDSEETENVVFLLNDSTSSSMKTKTNKNEDLKNGKAVDHNTIDDVDARPHSKGPKRISFEDDVHVEDAEESQAMIASQKSRRSRPSFAPLHTIMEGNVMTRLRNQLPRRRSSIVKITKSTKVYMVVFACFCFSWIPYIITANISYICTKSCSVTAMCIAMLIFMLLGFALSASNPWIYSMRNRSFRMSLERLLVRLKLRKGRRQSMITGSTST